MRNERLENRISESKVVIHTRRLKVGGRLLHEGNLGQHTQAPVGVEGNLALHPQEHLGLVRLARIVRGSLVQTAYFKRALRTRDIKAIVFLS